MKPKKIPMRMCAVTRERFEKKELVRLVRTPEQEIKIDLSGKLNGKGAYLKKDISIIEKAQKTKVLDRLLETSIPDEIYEELKKLVK